MNRECCAEAGYQNAQALAQGDLTNAFDQNAAHRVGMGERLAAVAGKLGKSGVRGRHRNRVAVEAAAEGNALEHLHQNCAAAGDAAERRATADSFPKSCKIRHNAIELLRPAKGETKTGDHFVEYQQNPARGAKLADL